MTFATTFIRDWLNQPAFYIGVVAFAVLVAATQRR